MSFHFFFISFGLIERLGIVTSLQRERTIEIDVAQDNNRLTKEGKKKNKSGKGKKMWILEKVIKASKLKQKAGVSKKFGFPISNKDILPYY